MSWNYSGNPSASNLDSVRFLCGDTDIRDQQLQDAEINFLLSNYGNIYKCAAYACKDIAAKYGRQVDKSVGDLRLSYSQRQKSYSDLSKDLLRQSALRSALPYAGGISKQDKEQNRLDPDTVQPAFTKKQFHYPEGLGTIDGGPDICPVSFSD